MNRISMEPPVTKPRKQCAKCPWKTSTDPHDIPDGYSEDAHKSLASTIAAPGSISAGGLRVFACHESKRGRETPCVGWLVNQLGPGNNIALRLAVMSHRVDANVRTIGPQHDTFEDTLPGRTRAAGPRSAAGSARSPRR